MFGKIIKFWDGLGYKQAEKYDDEVKTVKFVNKSSNDDPKYAHEGDSGFDLRAWITKKDENAELNSDGKYYITLDSLERRLIHTGLYVELPENTEAQVRPRSGLALKQGISVVNTPGTVEKFLI